MFFSIVSTSQIYKVNVPIAVRIGLGQNCSQNSTSGVHLSSQMYTASRILTTMGPTPILTAMGTFTLLWDVPSFLAVDEYHQRWKSTSSWSET